MTRTVLTNMITIVHTLILNLYLIIFVCNKLSEIIDLLPDDEFKKYFKTTIKENLLKMTCYVINNNSQINCKDFYENFLKRKKVNKEILSKTRNTLRHIFTKIKKGQIEIRPYS